MPSLATITLTKSDGTTTYDFNVSKKIGETVWYRNTTEASTSAGQQEFSVLWSGASPNRQTDKSVIKYACPKEHTVDGVVVVDDIGRTTIDTRLPANYTATERADHWAAVQSLVNNALIEAMMEDAEALY